jgi:DNA polymerase
VDFETRSFRNVKDTGAWRYAEDPTTEILCMAYRFDGGDTKLWAPGLPFPQEIIDHAADNGLFEAHNVQFERAIWRFIILRDYGISVPKRWRDTLAVCAYRAIPLGLDQAGLALGLRIQKDKKGKYLIQTLCSPKGGTKADPNRIYREDLDLMEELYEYCMQDVDAEYELGRAVGTLPTPEYHLWVLDQIINQRGVKLHTLAVKAALKVVDVMEMRLNSRLSEITDGQVTAATQRDKMLTWLRTNGMPVSFGDLTKATIEDTLSPLTNPDLDRLPADCIEVLNIRQTLAKSSTKKLVKMLETVSMIDDRIRGLLQYHGASTGRWAGRLVQPQNFPRGSLEAFCEKLGLDGPECMELLIQTILIALEDPHSAVDALEDIFGDAMEAIVTSLRGMFVADEGCVFMISDFAAIEAVVLAWLANETWKIEAFEKINNGEKYNGSDDIYCATASQIFQRTITKKEDKTERQVGKTCELAFGYQGAVGAWRNFDRSDKYSDEEVTKFKNSWRERHPGTVSLWWDMQSAAVNAVQTGRPTGCRSVLFDTVKDNAGNWLVCVLPNGRSLWYYEPVIEEVTRGSRTDYQLTYMGRDNKRGGAWGRVRSYGGMLVENIVQAISRDLMAEAMIRVEQKKYPIVITVHDEIIAEVKKDHGSIEEFAELMSIVPDWAKGCPVGVSKDVVTRYMKT